MPLSARAEMLSPQNIDDDSRRVYPARFKVAAISSLIDAGV